MSPWVNAVAPEVLQLLHESQVKCSWGISASVSYSVDTQIPKTSIEARSKDICNERDRRDNEVLP